MKKKIAYLSIITDGLRISDSEKDVLKKKSKIAALCVMTHDDTCMIGVDGADSKLIDELVEYTGFTSDDYSKLKKNSITEAKVELDAMLSGVDIVIGYNVNRFLSKFLKRDGIINDKMLLWDINEIVQYQLSCESLMNKNVIVLSDVIETGERLELFETFMKQHLKSYSLKPIPFKAIIEKYGEAVCDNDSNVALNNLSIMQECMSESV